MSSPSARFSSSSRSMRSIKDFSCAPATPPTSGMIPSSPGHDAAPAARSRTIASAPCRRKARRPSPDPPSMLLKGGESGLLLAARFLLVFRPPFVIGHAVDDFPRFGICQREAAILGFGAIPFGEAVAAKASEVHQIDVLNVGPLAQMLDEAAEGCGFQFGAGLVVHRDLLLFAGLYVALQPAGLKHRPIPGRRARSGRSSNRKRRSSRQSASCRRPRRPGRDTCRTETARTADRPLSDKGRNLR